MASLQKHASETERADMFSKCKFYAENEFEINDLESLKKLIESVDVLLSTTQYKEIVEKSVKRENLIALHNDLINEYVKEQQVVLKSYG